MADGMEPTGRRRRGKNNVHHVIDMQFQSEEPKRKGKLSAEGKQCAAADAADIGKQSGDKEDVDIAVTIRTACRPKQFRKTMVSLSDEKVVICHELGFDTMLRLRCGALNLPLCQMMVESFDVGQSCIKIHGRILKITHQDFGRIMGLRVGGRDVIPEGSVDDADTVALGRKICGSEEGINIHGLKRLVIDSERNDDIFKVSLVLYALATLLCPEPGNHVDQRYLVAVKDPNAIASYNWAKFGFAKLVEGVSSFQSKGFGVFRGWLIFLQLFYLEVVRSNFGGMLLCDPVREWGAKEAKKVFQMVEKRGGFKSESLLVSKKLPRRRVLSEMSLSVDGSTGIKLNVCDDLNEVKSEVGFIKGDIENLQSTLGILEPDMARLRGAVLSLENSFADLRSLGVGQIVSDVVKAVLEETSFFCDIKNGLAIDPLKSSENDVSEMGAGLDKRCQTIWETPLCTSKDARASPWDGMPNDSDVIAISNSEAHLLSYLFSKKVNRTDGSGSDEVARYAGQIVTRWDLTCLSPMNHLNAEVVNISVAYLSDSSIDTLFLPSTFSEMGKEYSASVPAQGLVPSTIKLCGLGRYSGRMKHCKKVFIPIHDDILNHWFLVVLNAMQGQCEIWDSNPDKSANKRREDYTVASTLLLDMVFAAEMPKSPDVYPKWGSFVITHPDNNPTHQIIQDSGLFVIRNMQFYRKLWYQGFNSGDQRVRLALEIVNHPRNVVAGLVWKAAKDEVPLNSVTPGVPLLSADQEGTIPVGGIKFTPRRPHRFWP